MVRRSGYWLALCALLLVIGAAFASTASAHARLKTSEPAASAMVAQAPAQVTLTFTEETSPTKSGGSVTDAGGATVSTGFAVDLNERTKMTIPLKPGLGPGAYTVQYNTFTDDDGGMVADRFVFTISAGGAAGAVGVVGATIATPTVAGAAGATVVASAATRAPSVTLVPAISAPATGAVASTTASGSGSGVPVIVWLLVALAVVGALAFGVRLARAQRR